MATETDVRVNLPSAGAEVPNPDGDQRLARVGDLVLQLATEVNISGEDGARSQGYGQIASINSAAEQALTAERAGIAYCVKLNEGSGSLKSELALAISALVGAVLVETNDLDTITRMVKRLNQFCVHNAEQRILAVDDTDASHDHLHVAEESHFNDAWFIPEPDPDPLPAVFNLTPPGTDEQVSTLERPADVHPAYGLEYEEAAVNHLTTEVEDYTSRRSNSSANNLDDLQSVVSIEWSQLDDRGHAEEVTFTKDNRHITLSNILIDHPAIVLRPRTSCADEHCPAEDISCRGSNPLSRKGRTARKTPRRNRVGGKHPDVLISYTKREKERCVNHGQGDPEHMFLSGWVLRDLNSLSAQYGDIFALLHVSICSPEAMATLRSVLLELRDVRDTLIPSPRDKLSLQQRCSVIANIDQKSAYFLLLRRCHILSLWDDCVETTCYSDGWVTFSAQPSLNPNQVRGAGNPRNLAHATTTRKLLVEIYPGLDEKDHDYKWKYETVKKHRKLGERLHILRRTFNEGVLGLIHCSEPITGRSIAQHLTDHMLRTPSDEEFKRFVVLLDRLQGGWIRASSDTMIPIMRHLFAGTLLQSEPFPLERVEEEQILQLPKGSKALLSLVSP